MKALITLAATVALSAAFASDGISSANIVGYANKEMRQGNTATGAGFVNVSGDASNLNDLKVTGYGDSYRDGGIILTKLDKSGNVKDNVYWAWWDCEDPEMGTLYGWYDEEGNKGDTEALALGEGVWIQAPNSAIKIMVAGQVYSQAVAVQLRQGNTLVCNPHPVNRNLNDAKVTGYGASYRDGGIILTKLDKSGNVKDNMYWAWWDCEDPDMGTLYGWYNDDGVEGSTESLDAGDATWIQAPNDTIYVNFAKAL